MSSRGVLLGLVVVVAYTLAARAEEPPGAPIEEPIPPAAEVAPDGTDSPPATSPEGLPGGIEPPLGDDEPGEGPPPIPGSSDEREEESEYAPSAG